MVGSTLLLFVMLAGGILAASAIGQGVGNPFATFGLALVFGFLIARTRGVFALLERNRALFSRMFGSGSFDALGLFGSLMGFAIILFLTFAMLAGANEGPGYFELGMVGLLSPLMLRQIMYFMAAKKGNATR